MKAATATHILVEEVVGVGTAVQAALVINFTYPLVVAALGTLAAA